MGSYKEMLQFKFFLFSGGYVERTRHIGFLVCTLQGTWPANEVGSAQLGHIINLLHGL